MRHLVSPAGSQRENNLRSGETEHVKASEVSWELFVGSDASLLVSEWPRREAIVWWQCLAVNKPRYLATPPTDCVRNSILQREKRLFFLSILELVSCCLSRQVAVVSSEEWERIQASLSHADREAEQKQAQLEARKNLHKTSKAIVSNWENTIEVNSR